MRLIDADKFILALMDAPLSSVDEDTILDLVDSVPTVDAVPVVRCKDCAFSQPDGWVCCSSAALMPRRTFPDSFCSDGEKKDEVNES